MLKYNPELRDKARELRSKMTDSEQLLWSRIRRKQILGAQLYRQRPIGNYIVDFFAPTAKLVIEVDGSHYVQGDQPKHDQIRDGFLADNGLFVLRFTNLEVLRETDAVLGQIFEFVSLRTRQKSPQTPL